jgi:hypothetical protein
VWVTVSVMNGQRAEDWGLEGGNLQGLYRMGWQKDTVKTGDKVTVRIHPRKDGGPGGQIMNLTQADGHVLGRAGE